MLDDWERSDPTHHFAMRKFFNLPMGLTTEEKAQIVTGAFKFIFVRNPFVRLVSTFRDKVIKLNYRNWQKQSLTFNNNSVPVSFQPR